MRESLIDKLSNEINISEIYLFGSYARKDNDENSDIDILIVIDDCNEKEYISYKEKFAKTLHVPVEWISLYRASKILRMYQYGSYFLWHIKKEGINLYSRNNQLEKLLETLPKYKNVRNDLTEYKQIVEDIEHETEESYFDIDYELSVLASLVRNTCIAIAYLNGKFDFGRNSVIITCKQICNNSINFTLDEYIELYKYRLYQTGKLNSVKAGSKKLVLFWLECEKSLLEIALEGVEKNER